jgi:hypothetical protein
MQPPQEVPNYGIEALDTDLHEWFMAYMSVQKKRAEELYSIDTCKDTDRFIAIQRDIDREIGLLIREKSKKYEGIFPIYFDQKSKNIFIRASDACKILEFTLGMVFIVRLYKNHKNLYFSQQPNALLQKIFLRHYDSSDAVTEDFQDYRWPNWKMYGLPLHDGKRTYYCRAHINPNEIRLLFEPVGPIGWKRFTGHSSVPHLYPYFPVRIIPYIANDTDPEILDARHDQFFEDFDPSRAKTPRAKDILETIRKCYDEGHVGHGMRKKVWNIVKERHNGYKGKPIHPNTVYREIEKLYRDDSNRKMSGKKPKFQRAG